MYTKKNLFEDQIAGPVSGRAHNGQYPALRNVNDVTEVLGPGRLSTAKEVLFTITWPAGSTQGQIEIEGSDDGAFTGSWAPLGSVPWSAANRKDQFRFSGGESNLRGRCSTAVDGADGAIVTAKGLC